MTIPFLLICPLPGASLPAVYHARLREVLHGWYSVKLQPNISDEALMKAVEQTLRLDMVPLKAPNEATAALS